MSSRRRHPVPARSAPSAVVALGAAVATVLAAMPAQAADVPPGFSRYRVIDLGTGRASATQPGQGAAGNTPAQATRWAGDGRRYALPGLNDWAGFMNHAGVTAGETWDPEADGGEHPVRWTRDGVLVDLHQPGDPDAGLVGLADDGTVAGYWYDADGVARSGWVVAPDGTRTPFPHVGTGEFAQPSAVSPDGRVAAMVNDHAGGPRRCGVLVGGRVRLLPLPAGAAWCSPTAVDAHGGVLATIGADNGNAWHGAVWRDGAWTDIGTLCGNWVEPHAMNAAGVVVARAERCQDAGPLEVVWIDGRMQALRDLLAPESAGWRVATVNHVADDGRIAGSGYFAGDGREHAIVLVPVAP